jgi:mRNA-degrading endonuclease YafQ of YafQ-DinJ toxin-antitoxin module
MVYNLAVKYGLTDCHIRSGFLLIFFVREAVKLLVVVVEGSYMFLVLQSRRNS